MVMNMPVLARNQDLRGIDHSDGEARLMYSFHRTSNLENVTPERRFVDTFLRLNASALEYRFRFEIGLSSGLGIWMKVVYDNEGYPHVC